MPTYLCHGFRWYRRDIRIFVILNDLDECAPDWIIERTTASFILSQFAEKYEFIPRLEEEQRPRRRRRRHHQQEDGTTQEQPDGSESDSSTPTQEVAPSICYDDELSMRPTLTPPEQDPVLIHDWSPIKLLEEHDERDLQHATRPFAYVADHVVRVDLGADVAAEMAKYAHPSPAWFEELRHEVQPQEESRWYVVVCQDSDRLAHCDDSESESDTTESTETETETEDGPPPPPASNHYVHDRVASAPEKKGLPPLPRDRTKLPLELEGASPPAFLDRDPYASGGPSVPRLKKKLSIRRLFSKKDT